MIAWADSGELAILSSIQDNFLFTSKPSPSAVRNMYNYNSEFYLNDVSCLANGSSGKSIASLRGDRFDDYRNFKSISELANFLHGICFELYKNLASRGSDKIYFTKFIEKLI